MAYIDLSVLSKYIDSEELIRLTDDTNSGIIDENKIDIAIKNASNELESYLRDVFIEPLPEPLPGELENILADITIYNLYKRRMQLNMPESIINIYKDAIDKLKKIREGIITISLNKKDLSGFIKINKTEDDRLFGKDILESL